jgi:hypothetical protein
MSQLVIYDPAMCCPSGMCGVSIDPEIIRVATTLHMFKSYNIEVKRYNLTSNPMEFVTQLEVNKYINEHGIDCLPITVYNNRVVMVGRYPTNQEMVEMVGLPLSVLSKQPKPLDITPQTK